MCLLISLKEAEILHRESNCDATTFRTVFKIKFCITNVAWFEQVTMFSTETPLVDDVAVLHNTVFSSVDSKIAYVLRFRHNVKSRIGGVSIIYVLFLLDIVLIYTLRLQPCCNCVLSIFFNRRMSFSRLDLTFLNVYCLIFGMILVYFLILSYVLYIRVLVHVT